MPTVLPTLVYMTTLSIRPTRVLNNRIYESNPQNADFNDLMFDGDERLIDRRQLYCINNDNIVRFNNGKKLTYK